MVGSWSFAQRLKDYTDRNGETVRVQELYVSGGKMGNTARGKVGKRGTVGEGQGAKVLACVPGCVSVV